MTDPSDPAAPASGAPAPDAPARPDPAAAAQFITALPHCHALGLTLLDVHDGRAAIAMPWSERLVGDPATGVLHGGAVSALMDTAAGAAVLCHPRAPVSTATLGLRIDYLRAARPRQAIVARAECHRVTRSVAFVRVEASDDEGPMAHATGTFALNRGGAS